VEVRLLVGILPWESQGELEEAQPAWVLFGRVPSKGIGVVPAPDGALLVVGDEARGVQVVGVNYFGSPNASFRSTAMLASAKRSESLRNHLVG
jgi:hypothetical protein